MSARRWAPPAASSPAFLAAANLVAALVAALVIRRCLEFCRTVPEIVFALIFVIAFGLGPLPGVLAIAIHTMGALGKLFSEVVENIDMKPVEGATATGASWPADRALRRRAAGAAQLRQLRAAALRDQCARRRRSWASSAPAASART